MSPLPQQGFAELVAPPSPVVVGSTRYPFTVNPAAVETLRNQLESNPTQVLFPNFVFPQDRDLRPRDFLRIREVGGSTLAASLKLAVSLFLGGQGLYTLDDLARDLDLGSLVLDMQQATRVSNT
jgi:hypothetical protein